MIRRSAAILGALVVMTIAFAISIGWSQLRPVDHIANVECPVFIMSGENDRNTRPTDTRMLVERARNPKEVWFVPNAGHVDLHRAARQKYEARILASTQSRQAYG